MYSGLGVAPTPSPRIMPGDVRPSKVTGDRNWTAEAFTYSDLGNAQLGYAQTGHVRWAALSAPTRRSYSPLLRRSLTLRQECG